MGARLSLAGDKAPSALRNALLELGVNAGVVLAWPPPGPDPPRRRDARNLTTCGPVPHSGARSRWAAAAIVVALGWVLTLYTVPVYDGIAQPDDPCSYATATITGPSAKATTP